ncbi:MAG: hypothetical protein NZ534_11470, partial [Bacteroidia bacterium]|nr:hypothetical protein [Bacteroidia bacterium]
DFLAALPAHLPPSMNLVSADDDGKVCLDVWQSALPAPRIRAKGATVLFQPVCERCPPVPDSFLRFDKSECGPCATYPAYRPAYAAGDVWQFFVRNPIERPGLAVGLCDAGDDCTCDDEAEILTPAVVEWQKDYGRASVVFADLRRCVRVCVYDPGPRRVLLCSEPIEPFADECETTLIRFGGCEDAFGFPYSDAPDFFQQFRVPWTISRPDFGVRRMVYRSSGGRLAHHFAQIEKRYLLRTDYVDDARHEAAATALAHRRFFARVEGEWMEFAVREEYRILRPARPFDYPFASAEAVLALTPYDKRMPFCGCQSPIAS